MKPVPTCRYAKQKNITLIEGLISTALPNFASGEAKFGSAVLTSGVFQSHAAVPIQSGSNPRQGVVVHPRK
jgi:hypothetical protein